MAWPEPVERIAVFLRATAAEARLEEFGVSTSTAREAAEAIGCPLEQVVKSLVFICGNTPVLALLPGDRRADPLKVAATVGEDVSRVASPLEVLAATGFDPGAVAPFPPVSGTHVFIERTILARPVVWVGAGSPQHMAGLSPPELLRLTKGEPADLVEESA